MSNDSKGSPPASNRLRGLVGITLLVLFASALTGLMAGTSELGSWTVLTHLATLEFSSIEQTILLNIRLPRVVLAATVGGALAVAGAVFQAILRNPLADPYILGISGGAALGGTLVLLIGPMTLGLFVLQVPLAAFAGAMIAMAFIFAVDRWAPGGRTNNYILLLTGVIFNAFASAIILFLKSVATPEKAQEILFYLMGSLSTENLQFVELVISTLVVISCVLILWYFARDLNVLSLGDLQAHSLGVSASRLKKVTVGVSSVAVAIAVAHSGLIGFVGLVVPHGVRLATGPDHRVVIPVSAAVGASFLILADALSRELFALLHTTLPVGVITAFIGAPVFILFLWRSFTGAKKR